MQTSLEKVLHFDSEIAANRSETPLGISEAQIVEFAKKHSSKVENAGDCPIAFFGSCWVDDDDKEQMAFERFLQNASGKVVIIYREGLVSLDQLNTRVNQAKEAGATVACAVFHRAAGIIDA